jgi:hypothetical protein
MIYKTNYNMLYKLCATCGFRSETYPDPNLGAPERGSEVGRLNRGFGEVSVSIPTYPESVRYSG